jgi:biopolymer transport protein ExbB/TolQ/gas vesicle protein
MLPTPESQKSSFCFHHALVIVFIPLLFLVGVVASYLKYIDINVEFHTLAIVAFIFMVFLFVVKHNANYAVCHMRGSFERMEDELRKALEANALTILNQEKSTLNVKQFIPDYYRGLRNDNVARVAPSVFPMLGILGTFTAIALSMPDFTVKDLASLDHEISQLLAGIGTAFYASIYGILLSLIWTYFEKRGTAKAQRKVDELERVYSAHVWKESELIRHRHMQSELKDQEIVKTLKETFNIDFVKELNEQYIKSFTTMLSEANSSFEALSSQMQNTSTELSQTLSKLSQTNEGVSAVTDLQANIEAFNKSTALLKKSLDGFDEGIEHTFETIDGEIGQVVEKLSSFAKLIADQNQMIMQTVAKLKKGQR